MRPTLGRVGVWIPHPDTTPLLARRLEELGYGAIWLGSSPGDDLAVVDDLLAATERMVVATGIVNVWRDDAAPIAAAHHRITDRFPGRFLLGVGIGHPEASADYRHPYASLVRYLDALDTAGVPADERVLAALGSKVLHLAAERSAGAHPYLVTPEHTRRARQLIGPDALLAPEQLVLIDPDPDRARATARPRLTYLLGLSNYLANLRRLGFTDDDFADGGSDRLVDELVATGDAPTAAGRIRDHLAAGADHVAIQLLTPAGADPLDGYRALAAELTGPRAA
jgi:probable F420-dependent oxidoreductase